MHEVWRAMSRSEPSQVHLLAGSGVGLSSLLAGRRVDAVVTSLEERQLPALRDSALALWCVRWLEEAREVSHEQTRIAVATHFRRGQLVADALEVAGWFWQGLGGLRDDRVLLWGSGAPDAVDPVAPPDGRTSLGAWLAPQLDASSTAVDPIGGSCFLRPFEDLGLHLVGRARRGKPRLYDLDDAFELSSCHKRSGVWQAAVLQAVESGKSLQVAAGLAGVHPSTVYKARSRDASFARAVEKALGR